MHRATDFHTNLMIICFTEKYESKPYNHLFWSPAGQFILLAGLKSANHSLEFIDTSDFTTTAVQEHFMATDVEWDPTGRFVVTSNSFWVHRADNSFWFWTFQGRLIRKVTMEGFCQLLWRPRPPCLLSAEKLKEIQKNLKKYSGQFEMKDRMAMSRVSEEILAKRKELMAEFKAYRDRRQQEFRASQAKRAKLREGHSDLSAEAVEEETIEFFTKEEVTVCQ